MKMRCRYRLTTTAKCPVDGTEDEYEVLIVSDEIVQVEKILKVAKFWVGKSIFQEELTAQLAIATRAKAITKGRHSGVETVCSVDERRSTWTGN